MSFWGSRRTEYSSRGLMHCILHIGCKAELHLKQVFILYFFNCSLSKTKNKIKTNKYNDIAVILKLIINDIFIDIIKINHFISHILWLNRLHYTRVLPLFCTFFWLPGVILWGIHMHYGVTFTNCVHSKSEIRFMQQLLPHRLPGSKEAPNNLH